MDSVMQYIKQEQDKVSFLLEHSRELMEVMYKTKNTDILDFFSEAQKMDSIFDDMIGNDEIGDDFLDNVEPEMAQKLFINTLNLFDKADKLMDWFIKSAMNLQGEKE